METTQVLLENHNKTIVLDVNPTDTIEKLKEMVAAILAKLLLLSSVFLLPSLHRSNALPPPQGAGAKTQGATKHSLVEIKHLDQK